MGQLSSLLTQPLKPAILAERVLAVDADLRPEGKSGPMVRSLESYAEYYRRWSLGLGGPGAAAGAPRWPATMTWLRTLWR